ncbi:hypothetical protein ACLOJK_027853 [Asimina triloba]
MRGTSLLDLSYDVEEIKFPFSSNEPVNDIYPIKDSSRSGGNAELTNWEDQSRSDFFSSRPEQQTRVWYERSYGCGCEDDAGRWEERRWWLRLVFGKKGDAVARTTLADGGLERGKREDRGLGRLPERREEGRGLGKGKREEGRTHRSGAAGAEDEGDEDLGLRRSGSRSGRAGMSNAG